MFGATFTLAFALLGSNPAPEALSLVHELGSPRYAQRESAESSLIQLGRLAIPALRAAKDSKDPEIRVRVASILARLEGSMLVEPTPVALDFQDVPLGQALRAINDQAGISLVLEPGTNPQLAGRRITIQTAEPLPFWKAIDALCAEAHLGYDDSSGPGEGSLVLHDAPAVPGPTNDVGPFRVRLSKGRELAEELPSTRLRANRLRQFEPITADVDSTPTLQNRLFFLQLTLAAEPRLSVTQNGPIKITTAIDNRGQSLLQPKAPGTFQQFAGYFGISPSPVVRLRLDLARPDAPGDRIRLIRGSIPILVASRKSDPLEIPLADSAGKAFQNDDALVTIRELRPALRNVPPVIDLVVRPKVPVPTPLDLGGQEPLGYRAESPQQQIEILDAQGQPLAWFPTGTYYNGEETRLILSLSARDRGAVPATIRYHGIIRATSEVAFEFRDVPMP